MGASLNCRGLASQAVLLVAKASILLMQGVLPLRRVVPPHGGFHGSGLFGQRLTYSSLGRNRDGISYRDAAGRCHRDVGRARGEKRMLLLTDRVAFADGGYRPSCSGWNECKAIRAV